MVCAAMVVVVPAGLGAQGLPSAPIQAAGGRVVVSAEVSAAAGPTDEGAYFNYTDYEHSALRLFRLALSAAWRLDRRVSVLGEVRTENWDTLRTYALYVRVRPWLGREFDVQAGRIPPSFGSFARRAYANENPLIGYPLAYQYLTSLRPDAVPSTAGDLLQMRGRGWRVQYPLGSGLPGPGVPLATAFRWDLGVQARVAVGALEATAALTNGTLANPRVADDNGGKQIAGRAAWRPVPGLIAGVSAARGEFLSDEARGALPAGLASRRGAQRAFGADLEYSRGYWLARAETIVSVWDMPGIGLEGPLRAHAIWAEGRYRLSPRLFVAGRADHLGFSRIVDALSGDGPVSWDAPVTRLEAGGGYYLQRNVVVKAVYQHNWRDGGRERTRRYVAGQILYWF
jgi:hypothetical protein